MGNWVSSREALVEVGNSKEVKGTQGNLGFFKGSARRSNGGKNSGKGGKDKKKREDIEALYDRLKIYKVKVCL